MTLLERAYEALIGAGVDARLATLHEGKCGAPYCVVYEGGTEPLGRTLCRRHILADALVPASTPEALPGLAAQIAAALQGGAELTPAGVSSTAALENYAAVTQTLDYTALCGME